jgi:urea carboxylase
MTSVTEAADLRGSARYTWGGDEFLFVEIAEAMSLAANFKASSIATRLSAQNLAGLSDICPSNASLLIRFDPDVIDHADLEKTVRALEVEVDRTVHPILHTRLIEVPVWYGDPYTKETVARFRSSHQRPEGTDLDFAAEANELQDAAEFIRRHHSSPWLVSMVGFVAGLPFMFQMVSQDKQLEVPKYPRPRTDTPALTVGHGGCFACIYSVRGAGGYQMFGIAAAPIFDPAQSLKDFTEFMIFFKPGDIVKFRSIDEAEYMNIKDQVKDGSYVYKQVPVTFDLVEALSDPESYNEKLLEQLDGV